MVVCSYWSTCLQVLSAPLIHGAYHGCLFILVYLPGAWHTSNRLVLFHTVVVCSLVYLPAGAQRTNRLVLFMVVVCSYWSTCLQVLGTPLIDWYCFMQGAYRGSLFILVYLPAGTQRTSNRLVLFIQRAYCGCLFILVYLPAGAQRTSNRLVLFHTKSILWLFVHIGLPACRCSAHL